MKVSRLAHDYLGGLTHAHTVLSNHPGHHESNLTIDRIVDTLAAGGLVGEPDSPLGYVMLNEHPSDPDAPRRLGRLSLRGRRLLKQRRRPVVGRVPVLYGLEVSLLPGGRTDLTPRLADRCPLVLASAHRLPLDTERHAPELMNLFADACSNPAIEVIGHPARYIEDLDDINWPKLFAKAYRTGTAIEINLNTFPHATDRPWRQKFWDQWLSDLAASKAWIFIGTDIHNKLQLEGFVSGWQEMDESASRDENQLARFLLALRRAGIDPERVATAHYERFSYWLALDKDQRARA